MIKNYITSIESHDKWLEVLYFKMEMFDEESITFKSDVCIGDRDELEEFLTRIREAYLTILTEVKDEKK
jgi:L-fucose isomerase-like protein